MTAIVKNPRGDRPQIHAFVVGVGAYRYLSGVATANPRRQIDGEQLSSPPHSARAFADWLLTKLRHPDAELGTVELLLSAARPDLHQYRRPDTAELVDVEVANAAAVEDAFWRWFRQFKVEQDIAMFYFCGHGLQREHTALLLEDFGANDMDPFRGAMDFEANWRGMDRCLARRQYYFVDACQSHALAMRKQLTDEAQVFLKGQTDSPYDAARRGATFFGTAPSKNAYGRRNDVSVFTTALLEALDGIGAEQNDDDEWVVTPLALKNAIERTLADQHHFGGIPRQDPRLDQQVGNDALHRIDGTPRFPLTVLSDPREALPLAALTVGPYARGPAPGRFWLVRLEPATYQIVARFPSSRFRPFEGDVGVRGPRRTKTLPVA